MRQQHHGSRFPIWHTLLLASTGCADIVLPSEPFVTSSLPESTCKAQTINYITHTLPQQCLATERSKPTAISYTANATSLSLTSSLSTETRTSIATVTSLNSTHAASVANTTSSPVAINTLSTTTSSTSTETIAPSNVIPILDTTQSSIALPSLAVEEDGDPLFGDSDFLSFEEWKVQNLARSGQSAETLGQGRKPPGPGRAFPGIENALESIGDDNEIVLDFSGFGGPANVPVRDMPGGDGKGSTTSETAKAALPSSMPRNKEAGKTSKERFNYASFDCAANVLKTNPQCKHSSSILVENKDRYMLNKCAADNKFLIVELCDDILVDTIVLANYEFFSSMFRAFRVSVSDKYPVKIDRWKELGTFEARNSRDIQAFLIENPLIWARYVRIEFITHYGSEYYCPVSLLRVHGTTMMAEFRHQEELARGEVDNDDEDEVVGSTDIVTTSTVPALVGQVTLDPEVIPSAPAKVYEPIFEEPIQETTSSERMSIALDTSSALLASASSVAASPDSVPAATRTNSFVASSQLPPPLPQPITLSSEHSTAEGVPTLTAEVRNLSSVTTSTYGVTDGSGPSTNEASTQVASHSISSASLASDVQSSVIAPITSSSPASSVLPTTRSSSTSTALPTQTPPNQPPATQESFFKSIHKRLQFLETNATLSLQYIESQSQNFRDAFHKVERRNIAKTSTFLDALNATVSAELALFKAEYEQLWQSTVLELASQRDENRQEAALMADRVRMLAEELVGQKRLIAVQATLLLLCLGLILFSKFVGGSSAVGITDPNLLQLIQELSPRARMKSKAGSVDLKRSPRWSWSPASPSARDLLSLRNASTDEEEVGGKNNTTTILEEDEEEQPEGMDDFKSAARLTKSAPVTPRTESPNELGLDVGEDEEGEEQSALQASSSPAS